MPEQQTFADGQAVFVTDDYESPFEMQRDDFKLADKELSGEADIAGQAQKLDTVGESIEGLFGGLRFSEARDGRAFYIAQFVQRDGSTKQLFLSRKLHEFLFSVKAEGYNQIGFPIGRYLKIELAGTQLVAGRNPMKLYSYKYPSSLKLRRQAFDILTPAQALDNFNPLQKKLPAGK